MDKINDRTKAIAKGQHACTVWNVPSNYGVL